MREIGDRLCARVLHIPECGLAQFEIFLDGVANCTRHCLPGPVIVAGDFNAWSARWGSRRTNARGRVLENWAAALGLCLLNTGTRSTFVRWQGKSVVDLT